MKPPPEPGTPDDKPVEPDEFGHFRQVVERLLAVPKHEVDEARELAARRNGSKT